MDFFKPNIWKILFSFLLFSIAITVILALRFVHSCGASTEGFVALNSQAVNLVKTKVTFNISDIVKNSISFLKTSCDINPDVSAYSNLLAYVIIALVSYLFSCIILFLPHRDKS